MVHEAKPSTQQHYDFLDGLRAILALYVIAYHCLIMSGAANSIYFRLFEYGRYPVCFFIVLSGFCLTLPILKTEFKLANGAGSFFRRRAWRILPPYYSAVAVSLLAIVLLIHTETGTFWDYSLPVTPKDVLLHLVLLQNFSPNDYFKINPVLWTIAVEWQIYFVFPLLLWGWRSFGARSTTLAVILISLLVEFGLLHFLSVVPSVNFLGLFAMGMLAAHIGFYPNPFAGKFKSLPWILILVLTGSLALYLDTVPHGVARLIEDACVGCSGASILVLAGLNPQGGLRRLLDFKPLVFIGSFSYSIYLIHAPLLQILWQFLIAPLKLEVHVNFVILLAIGVPVLVTLAYLFFLFGERPFLQKKGRKIAHIP